MTGNGNGNGAARIKVRNAGKAYGPLQVFKDIDLTVGEREIVTVVGPSGCGKTTLLRCIDGLLPLSEGTILIEDEAVLMGDRVVVLKGRPAKVFETIEVDLPAPRDRGTLSHPRFNEIREHVWSTLVDEARAAEFVV